MLSHLASAALNTCLSLASAPSLRCRPSESAAPCPDARVLCQDGIRAKSLTLAWYLTMIRAMRQVVATVTAIRFALSARRGVLLELLTRHHHVAVCLRETPNVFRPLNLSAASVSEARRLQ
jgi:hypothetical protein